MNKSKLKIIFQHTICLKEVFKMDAETASKTITYKNKKYEKQNGVAALPTAIADIHRKVGCTALRRGYLLP